MSPSYYMTAGAPTRRAGFSLVEVMVAMAIFGIAAAGLTALIQFAYRSATHAVYQTTAHAVAQGYVEQIMAHDFQTVKGAYDNRSNTPPQPLVLRALSPSTTTGSAEMNDPLNFSGNVVEKDIVVDLRENDSGDPTPVIMKMEVWMTATERRITRDGAWEDGNDDLVRALEITINYRFQRPLNRGWSTERISFVKSDVAI